MDFLKRWSTFFRKKASDERIGQAWVTEVLPIYHDHAFTTNKSVWVVEEIIQSDVVRTFLLDSTIQESKPFRQTSLLTQDGVPVKFNKKGRIISESAVFEKEGYQRGQLYFFEGLGFLGNIEVLKEVWLVTDQFVFFRTADHYDSMILYHYPELGLLKPKKMA